MVGWALTATFEGDVDAKRPESFGERAREASKCMRELTEGQMYVREISVTDTGGAADDTILADARDAIKIGGGRYKETAGGGPSARPGKSWRTFFYELIHLEYGSDRGTNCKHCIMSSDPCASQICDDADKAPPATSCWALMRRFDKGVSLKLLRQGSKAEIAPVPETKVNLRDR